MKRWEPRELQTGWDTQNKMQSEGQAETDTETERQR